MVLQHYSSSGHRKEEESDEILWLGVAYGPLWQFQTNIMVNRWGWLIIFWYHPKAVYVVRVHTHASRVHASNPTQLCTVNTEHKTYMWLCMHSCTCAFCIYIHRDMQTVALQWLLIVKLIGDYTSILSQSLTFAMCASFSLQLFSESFLSMCLSVKSFYGISYFLAVHPSFLSLSFFFCLSSWQCLHPHCRTVCQVD